MMFSGKGPRSLVGEGERAVATAGKWRNCGVLEENLGTGGDLKAGAPHTHWMEEGVWGKGLRKGGGYSD